MYCSQWQAVAYDVMISTTCADFVTSPAAAAAVQKERWDGAWVGQQAAQQVFKADEVYSIMEVRLPAS
jgi:predicted HD phosphohydrolase